VIHVSSPTPIALIALSYARQNKIPIVAAYHTDFTGYFKYYKFGLVESIGWNYLRWFYNKYDRILAPSQTTRNNLDQHGFKNTALWKRGVDTNFFTPAKIKEDRNAIRLMFAGRLVKEKDIVDVVKVCQKLSAENIPYEMVFVGDGELNDYIKQELPSAKITGFIHKQDLAEAFAQSDIFLFPSTTETFGNVALEALSAGLPVLCSNKGAVQDLVLHGKTGFIAQAHNIDEMVSHVKTLIMNDVLRERFSKAARSYALNYSWESIHLSLLDTYLSLLPAKTFPQIAALNPNYPLSQKKIA
jgi:glycosyltransferase involved in cell wall biosynthesis